MFLSTNTKVKESNKYKKSFLGDSKSKKILIFETITLSAN